MSFFSRNTSSSTTSSPSSSSSSLWPSFNSRPTHDQPTHSSSSSFSSLPTSQRFAGSNSLLLSLAVFAIATGVTAVISLHRHQRAAKDAKIKRTLVKLVAKRFRSKRDDIINLFLQCSFNNFNREELLCIYEKFQSYCEGDHGYISRHRFEQLLISIGIRDKLVLSHLFQFWDQNHDNFVDFYEIIKSFNLVLFADKVDHLKQYFGIFDLNDDGNIAPDEFRKVISAFGDYDETTVNLIFNKVDTNKNGNISLREFLAIANMVEVDFTFNSAILKLFGIGK